MLRITAIFILSLSGLIGHAQGDWRLDKDKEGIKVYTRAVEGSNFREFKAIMTVQSDIASIERILDHFEDFPNWQANMDSVSLVRKISANSKVLYFQSDLPWPVTNRDFIFRQVKEQNSNILTYHNFIAPDEMPKQDGFIRVTEAGGFWRISKTTSGIEVIYQWKGDPAGSIPGWLTNMFIVEGPHETLLNLKEKLKK